MKVLITGGSGQLGKALTEEFLANGHCVSSFSKEQFDITDYKAVDRIFREILPDIVINAAAYTKVDDCEVNQELAFDINVIGPRNLAIASEFIGAKIVHISTDFVFDGNKHASYTEDDVTKPLSVYGKSKLQGESEVTSKTERYFIIRTSWLYGKYGNNFVKTMITLSSAKSIVRVVNDQIGCPTSVSDLVQAISKIIETEKYGIYNFANTGQCSWYEFASEIFRINKISTEVIPISSEELNRLAKRPAYSVLSTEKIQSTFDIQISDWKVSLSNFFNF